jgi:Thymidylate synthase complementing protein
MSDDAAVKLALDPAQNRYLGEAMTVTTLSKLSRAMVHAGYTFKKRLSHTADSQDQRHRMTPGSRPILAVGAGDAPDYISPKLLDHSAAARVVYDDAMARTWEAVGELRRLGVAEEWLAYLLPNAVTIRFTESADLLNLHHKLKSRLCYNAQEEIWQASVDEARQIRGVNPLIGRYLLPPCGVRLLAGQRPICPEGDKYCGVPVWKLDVSEYSRVI